MGGLHHRARYAWPGDSPILGAGLYVDGAIGAAGSTGRGEANLYNLSSYLVVEALRQHQGRRTENGPQTQPTEALFEGEP